jgi:hypothetical protein
MAKTQTFTRVSGCGGSSANFDASATESCLVNNGADVNHEDADYIALAAVNGGYLVHVGETAVNVSFYRNGSDAAEGERAYSVFGGTSSTLYTKGNAVLAWDDTPTDTEKATVEDCLTAVKCAEVGTNFGTSLLRARGGASRSSHAGSSQRLTLPFGP